MSSTEEWGEVPLSWERISGALAESRRRGWKWEGTPAGSAAPETLLGRSTTSTHDDVVIIEMLRDPVRAIGARFAPGDWGKHGTTPLRGPVDGPPDTVLVEVMGWSEEAVR